MVLSHLQARAGPQATPCKLFMQSLVSTFYSDHVSKGFAALQCPESGQSGQLGYCSDCNALSQPHQVSYGTAVTVCSKSAQSGQLGFARVS